VAIDYSTTISYSTIFWSLERGAVRVPELYAEVLAPALNSTGDEYNEQKISIWKEHERSSIIRTIIECCFPYVIKERDNNGILPSERKAVIFCPDGETHELGARMAADFYTLCGFHAIFIGSSTPLADVMDMLEEVRPEYTVISVTNYYNLVAARKAIADIRANYSASTVIAVGGHAFRGSPDVAKEIGADILVGTFEEIAQLKGPFTGKQGNGSDGCSNEKNNSCPLEKRTPLEKSIPVRRWRNETGISNCNTFSEVQQGTDGVDCGWHRHRRICSDLYRIADSGPAGQPDRQGHRKVFANYSHICGRR